VAAERTLTTRELNRALLARQFLLQPSSHSVVDTIERIGGLQTQYAPSGYIGIWSRMKAFRRNDLTTALEHRRIIQGTLLRNTIHMVSPRDYWLFLAGTRASRQEWFRRITKKEYGELPIDAAAAAGIRPVLCRQERVGVGIADGFSRTTNGRRLGVFAMQYGPGAENAFAGVATAAPEREEQLSNLLNIIGRRSGPRSIISIG